MSPEASVGALASARSMLFVPGDRPERFDKAEASGADRIVIDLEDAVAPEAKSAARAAAHEWLGAGGSAVVRINGCGTAWHGDDVAMVAAHGCPVMLPKADDESVNRLIVGLPEGTPVVALVETAAGILAAGRLAALPAVVRVAFGGVDLGAELNVDPEAWEPLLYARSALVLALAAAGAPPPLDGVTTRLDAVTLERATAGAARLGFGGKLCIHPNQVATVNAAFTPDPFEVARARRIVDAAEGSGVTTLDGEMIDKPVVERARCVLTKAATAALQHS